MQVLVIAADQQVVKDITIYLKIRYPEAVTSSSATGPKGLDLLETDSPDLCVVDYALPETDVLDLIDKIRDFSEVPLVVLSEKDGETDRSKVLEAGADEYVIKPFNPIVFLSTVQALLRRTKGLSLKREQTFSVNDKLKINFTTNEVFLDNKQIQLTPIEYKLFSKLVRNEGRVVTHHALLEAAWGPEYINDTGFIKKYINRLRKKLEDDPGNPRMFITDRTVGYKFVRPH